MGILRKAARFSAFVICPPSMLAIDSTKTRETKKSAKELKRMRKIMERNERR